MSQLSRRPSRESDNRPSRYTAGPYHDVRPQPITDAGSLVNPEDMEITPYVPPETKQQETESSANPEPSSSSCVQNTMRQEQHNQYAQLNIVHQGPN